MPVAMKVKSRGSKKLELKPTVPEYLPGQQEFMKCF